MEHKVHFVVAALGRDCDDFTLHIYASLAEQERKMISERTKEGLARSKAKLGLRNPAMRSIVSARNAESASAASVPGVRMNVGATAFTVIPCLPHSTARHFVKCAIAAFVMQ